MSQEPQTVPMDPPSTDQPPAPAVLEFGGDSADAPRRMPSLARLGVPGRLADLTADRRLVPLAVGLGAVAIFVSLISEWQVTAVDGTIFGDTEVGNRPIEAGIVDLGGWGGGYLAGLFLLVGATVLLLFGPPPGRPYARLAGLSAGGVLLAILVALLAELGDRSRLGGVMDWNLDDDQFQVTYGRGIWCALVGVVLVTLGIHLAGRHLPALTAAPVAVAAPPVGDGGTPEHGTGNDDWPWRRPRTPDRVADPLPDAPLDLTVTPTSPFTPLGDTRDRPR